MLRGTVGSLAIHAAALLLALRTAPRPAGVPAPVEQEPIAVEPVELEGGAAARASARAPVRGRGGSTRTKAAAGASSRPAVAPVPLSEGLPESFAADPPGPRAPGQPVRLLGGLPARVVGGQPGGPARPGEDLGPYFRAVRERLLAAKFYPARARKLGFTGEALVEFTLDGSGRVQGLRVLRSSGFPDLDGAGLEAVRKASPLPAPPQATVAGGPLRLKVPFVYSLTR